MFIKINKTHRHRQQEGGYQREGAWEGCKGVKYKVTEDLALGGGHLIRYIDNVYCLIISL